jgi:hypothetical protein
VFFLDGCLLSWLGWNQPNQDSRQSSKKNSKYQLLYLYGVPPDDGLYKRPKHVEVFDEILKINCASSWFLFKRIYRDSRSTKHKIYVILKSVGPSVLNLVVQNQLTFLSHFTWHKITVRAIPRAFSKLSRPRCYVCTCSLCMSFLCAHFNRFV